MTGGGPGTATELMATYMYKESFKNFNMGYGSAIAGGMFIHDYNGIYDYYETYKRKTGGLRDGQL